MAKLRTDSWDSKLTEDQSWTAYITTRSMSWPDAVNWIAEEYHIEAPSRSAFYRFVSRMRADDANLRLKRAAASVNEAGALADQVGTNDTVLVNAYKTLAADCVMTSGDTEQAQRLVGMAMAIADRARGKAELELKERAQKTKDETLKLAREKFEAAERRIAQASDVVNDEQLTDEERIAKIKAVFGMK